MRTTAQIKQDNYTGRYYVVIELANGMADHPILYDHNGLIAYDNSERIPNFIKPKVYKLLMECKQLNKSLIK